jgi:hypothetical protein
MDDWPAYKRACDLSGTIFPVSEAVVLATARKYGIGRKMGRTIIFSREDIQHLYEVLPCPSGSCAAPNHPTGSSAVPSGAAALKKALAHLTDGSPKKFAQSGRPRSSPIGSTVVALRARSRRRP